MQRQLHQQQQVQNKTSSFISSENSSGIYPSVREQQQDPHVSINVVINFSVLGDIGVGKTCFLIKVKENKFIDEYQATLGVQLITLKNFKVNQIGKDINFTVNILDTCGERKFFEVFSMQIKKKDGFFIFYQFTQFAVFGSQELPGNVAVEQSLTKFASQLQNYVSYYFDQIWQKSDTKEINLCVLGTKIDFVTNGRILSLVQNTFKCTIKDTFQKIKQNDKYKDVSLKYFINTISSKQFTSQQISININNLIQLSVSNNKELQNKLILRQSTEQKSSLKQFTKLSQLKIKKHKLNQETCC